jgi:hypothetical protein
VKRDENRLLSRFTDHSSGPSFHSSAPNPKPLPDFPAALAADLELAADVGPVLVMDALSRAGVPPDAWQPLRLALGFLRLRRQHFRQ